MSDFSGHLPGSRAYRRLLIGLFFGGVATFAQLYATQAVLPVIAADVGASPSGAALTVSASTLGLAVAVIPWSIVADRVGRVPAMAIGLIAATLLGGITPFAHDLGILLALRLLEGAALGAVPAVALAYLSEEVDARHVAAAAGSYIAGTTVGGLTGRVVSGWVAELAGWRWGVASVVFVCVVAAALFLALVPAARGFVPGRLQSAPGPSVRRRLWLNLRSPVQLALYAQGFLLMGAFVAVYNYLGFHLSEPPFSLPPVVITLLFLAYLAGTVSSPRAGALAVRHGRLPVLLACAGVMTGGVALMFVPATAAAVVGLVAFTAGFFGAHAVASGWTPVAADPRARAQASSLYYLGYYAGSSVFGWALGLVFGAAGWGWFLGAVLAMCVVAMGLAFAALRPVSP
ncbi:MFS transporter [Microbacterium enclense]|uniref:Predicted arabinose efflux permease, MFS family n=1 Tax=Microbacterium enclense TaxID=993073 RepID=A0A1G6PDA4_9MICO|nr:MFS transporter [Microbacterium enclense]KSU52363.1 MFS transporter [Microbacterium enclense]MCM3614806.1 MFS transporter [Microbacterium enclense]SDC78230.1 Predicted arabinose efflux permease, MFS family [Microbacterium enclense]